MKKISIILLVVAAIVTTFTWSYAMQMDGCGASDCKDCHSLTQQEAEGMFQGLVEKVINVEMSPIRGLWQVNVESRGKAVPLYVDFSKKYIIDGKIHNVTSVQQSNKQPEEKVSQLNIAFSEIPIVDAILLGRPDAPKKVILFDDPDCPHCARLHEEVKKVIEKRKDIAFFVKLFPLEKHPDAYKKSKTIACTKSAELLDKAYAGEPLPEPACETTQIDDNIALGKKIGIRFIPALILQDGRIYSGFKDADSLIQLIDSIDKGKKED
ncbi:MAG TPA: DsbC family protein [Thermodesulfovibrionia bacterium]|nr:DsbC family protein [Thermodesulfovibrionia bacterium]